MLLFGIVWLALLLILWAALQVASGEQAGWRLLGYLALWTSASPLVGLGGLVLALIKKASDGSKTRTASIIVHALILVLSAGLLWNASRG